MKFLITFLLSVALAFGAELMPERRKGDWANAGIPGGLDAARAAIVTASMINLTQPPYSVDNTGATEVSTAFNSAKAAMTAEHGIYFPAGLYKTSARMALTNVTGKAIRGAGSHTTSTTTNTMVTSGTMTFTVPAGLPYTTGCGIWFREVESVTDENGWKGREWGQGTVSSYSGGTLAINVTSSSGVTGTAYSRWFLTITGFLPPDADAAGGFAIEPLTPNSVMGNPSASATSAPLVVGSPVRGATTITIDLGSSGYPAPTANSIGLLMRHFNWDPASGHADDSRFEMNTTGTPYSVFETVMFGAVTSLGGGQYSVAVSPALDYGYPVADSPRVTWSTSGTFPTFSGIEQLTIIANGSTSASQWLGIDQSYGCWLYDVAIYNPRAKGAGIGLSVNPEVRKLWLSHRSTTGAGGLLFSLSATRGALVEDNIFTHHYPNLEINAGSVGNVYAHNVGLGAAVITNHGAQNGYNLWEGNFLPFLISDGYHGGENDRTTFRNHLPGITTYTSHLGGTAGDIDGIATGARWSYNFSDLGNVLGRWDYQDGSVAMTGQPNMGNSDHSGTTVTPKTGTYWKHLNSSGSRITGTLTSKSSSTEGVITMTSLVAADLQDPHIAQSATSGNMRLDWGSKTNPNNAALIALISNLSGSTFTVLTNGTLLPDIGTTVAFYPGNAGYQDVDGDVPATRIEKGNYVVSGSGGSMTSLGGATLPDSLFRASKPLWFGTLQYPAINSAAPTYNMTNGIAAIPSGYRYANLEEVPDATTVATPQFSPAPGTHAAGTTLTILCGTSGATIHYTLDGSTPTTSSASYSTPISLSIGTTVVKTFAVKFGLDDSAVQTGSFTLVNAPVAASGLNATTASTTQINVTWSDNSDNETGFRLERRIGAGSWSTVTTTAANATSYSNTGLMPATTYEYRVYATNGAGVSSASNTDSATTDFEGGGAAFTPSTGRNFKLLFRR